MFSFRMLLCFSFITKLFPFDIFTYKSEILKEIPKSDQNFTLESIFTFAIYAFTWHCTRRDCLKA